MVIVSEPAPALIVPVDTLEKYKVNQKYLDELGIRYYAYDDVNVNRDEYYSFLKLLNIDSELFGFPAIIYINSGDMFGNIINVDSKEVVKRFVDDYDLYTVK